MTGASAQVDGLWSRVAVAVVIVGCGVLDCVGAVGPWVSVSIYRVTFTLGGFHGGLDGPQALGLGIAAIALGIVVALSPVRARWRLGALVAAVGVGVAGLVVIIHEGRHLESLDAIFRRVPGLRSLADFFGIGGRADWGLWMCGMAFGVMVLAAFAGLVQWQLQSSRRAPPSTGIAQPLMYDAAGDSANAATRPNSAGSP
jgi:hypothetical protein